MDAKVEAIKKAALSRASASPDMAGITPVIIDTISHFTSLVEGGSRADLHKLKVILKDVSKISEAAASGNSGATTDPADLEKIRNAVTAAKKACEHFVERKPPSPTKVLFSGAHAAEETPPRVLVSGDTKVEAAATAAEDEVIDDDDDDDDSSDDGLRDPDESVVRQRQDASRLHRWLQLGVLAIIIASCVGVVTVSEIQLDAAVTTARLDVTNQLLSIAVDGLSVISTKNKTSAAAAAFLDSMTRASSSGYTIPSSRPPRLVEFYGADVDYDKGASIRTVASRTTPRYPLLCVAPTTVVVKVANDLQYMMPEETKAFTNECDSVEGMMMWRTSVRGKRVQSPKETTYRGTYASTATQFDASSMLTIGVSVDVEDISQLGGVELLSAGTVNPLDTNWKRNAAIWISFAIGIGFTIILFVGELFSYLQSFYRRRRFYTAVYVVALAVAVLVIVAVAAGITWHAQNDSLNSLQVEHTELLRNAFFNAVQSPSLSTADQLTLANKILASSLAGASFILSVSAGVVPSGMNGIANDLQSVTNVLLENRNVLTTSTSGKSFATARWASQSSVLVVAKTFVSVTGSLLDSGRNCAGVILGSFGAVLVTATLFLFVSGLWDLFGGSFGGQQLLIVVRPFAARYLAYCIIGCVMMGTTVALSFYAAADVSGAKEVVAMHVSNVLAHAAVKSAELNVVRLRNIEGATNDGEMLAFQLDTTQKVIDPLFTPQLPPVHAATWANDYLAARTSLSSITTVFPSCPSYFRGSITPAEFADPGNAFFSVAATSYSPQSGIGGTFQQDRDFEEYSGMQYLVHLTMITTMGLSLIAAFTWMEDRIMRASEEDDEYRRPMHFYIAGAALILPAFAFLIGAGAIRPLMQQDVSHFVDNQLSIAATSVADMMERAAVDIAAVYVPDDAADAAVQQIVNSLILGFNTQSDKGGLVVGARWLLLRNASADLQSAKVIVGGETVPSSFLWQQDWTAPFVIGSVPSTVFNTTEPLRDLRFAAVPMLSSLPLASRLHNAYTLVLVMDPRASQLQSDLAWADFIAIAGTSVVATWLLATYFFWLAAHVTLWYNVPVVDSSAILPSLPVSENSKPFEPSPLPRYVRLCHLASFSLPVFLVVAFAVSCLCFLAQINLAGTPRISLSTYDDLLHDQTNNVATTILTDALSGIDSMSNIIPKVDFNFLDSSAAAIFANSTNALTSSVLSSSPFSNNNLLVDGDFVDYNAKFSVDYVAYVLDQVSRRSTIQATASTLISLLTNFYINATGSPDINLRKVVQCGRSLTKVLDYLFKTQTLERATFAALIDLSGSPENDFLVPNATLSILLRDLIITESLNIRTTLQTYAGFVIGNLTTITIGGSLVDSAVQTFSSVIQIFSTKTPIFDPSQDIWSIQARRIAQLRKEVSPKKNVTALQETITAFRSAADTARSLEQRTRSLVEFQTQKTHTPIFTATERLLSLREYTQLAASIITCAVLLLAASQLSTVWLNLKCVNLILHRSQEINMNTVVQAKNEDETDELISRSTQTHYTQHRRALFLSTALVLAACIPTGLGFWATSGAVDTAQSIIGGSFSSLSAYAAATNLLDTENILNTATECLLEPNGPSKWETFVEVSLLSQLRILERHIRSEYELNPSFASDRAKRFEEAELDIAQVKSLITLINQTVVYERRILDLACIVPTAAFVADLGRISYVATQKILSIATLGVELAMSPFSALPGNPLGDYFNTWTIDTILYADQAVTAAEKIATSRNLAVIVNEFQLVTYASLAELRAWSYLALATSENISYAVNSLGNLDFITQLIDSIPIPSARAAMQQYYGNLIGNFTSTAAAIQFLNTKPGTTILEPSDPADIVTLAAQAHQDSLKLISMAEFQRLYSFNRGI